RPWPGQGPQLAPVRLPAPRPPRNGPRFTSPPPPPCAKPGSGGDEEKPMATRTQPAPHAPRAETDTGVDPGADPWVAHGLLAGVVGAAAIALFFLALDVAAGRPLWTPNALGSALFLGVAPPPDAPISAALVGGYTVIHGWVFVSVALIASTLLVGARLPGRTPLAHMLVLAAVLFVA